MTDDIKEVSVREAYQSLIKNPGQVLLDVREPEEFQEVHAQGAVLRPLSTFDAEAIADDLKLSRQNEFFVICRSGARSLRAAEVFAQHGFNQAVNVAGGTLEWIESGLPTKM